MSDPNNQGQPMPPPPPAAPPPAAPPPPPPTGQSWQSTPQPPGQPPMGSGQTAGSGMPSWTSSLTDQRAVPGPAGLFYADVPNRFIAMVIDVIAMLVVQFILLAVATSIFGVFGSFPTTTSLLVGNVLAFLVWAAYFIFLWVSMRGTLGMKALGLQVGHESDGRTLTYQQAAIRFGVLFGPQIIVGLLAAVVPALGILGLLSFVWLIFVLVTMAQSPTKQGIHDKYARTMVVKGGRSLLQPPS